MKNLLPMLMIIGGIALGAYVGVWVMFIGGILGLVEVVNGLVDGTSLDGMLIVWSVLKMMFASLVAYMSAFVLILPAMTIWK